MLTEKQNEKFEREKRMSMVSCIVECVQNGGGEDEVDQIIRDHENAQPWDQHADNPLVKCQEAYDDCPISDDESIKDWAWRRMDAGLPIFFD